MTIPYKENNATHIVPRWFRGALPFVQAYLGRAHVCLAWEKRQSKTCRSGGWLVGHSDSSMIPPIGMYLSCPPYPQGTSLLEGVRGAFERPDE